ncbi:uncharacterized protein FIBRA_02115 [Fibroporia radiculosa]|uniref:F-box domain-containing protein n=1 Tax=Fibroporia radiculosa TaxID=599839 RepID=J4G1D0_9APHY|nr:uncharacterized protein FIBRA_02115 [Fibroporia radiculosa]CCM00088.1 predicted protein [Fibroporia radiculosa]
MHLTDLPEDLILEVFLYLEVVNLLIVKQTCRVLHAIGSSDYLWHCVIRHIGLPLNIPSGVPHITLSHEELQKIAVKAIRLEANWQKTTPVLKRTHALVRDTNEPYVDEMQFLPGGEWLLTAQRNRQPQARGSSRVVLWSLKDLSDVYRVADIEVVGFYRDCTLEYQAREECVTLAVGFNDGMDKIDVYRIPLQNRADFSFSVPTLLPTRTIPVLFHPRIADVPPVIHQMAISHGIVAITVAIPGGECPLQVYLTHAKSGMTGWVDPALLEPFSSLWVRLCDDHLLLLGNMRSSLILRIYRISRAALFKVQYSQWSAPQDAELHRDHIVDLGSIVVESMQPFRQDAEFYDIARVSTPSSSYLSVVICYAFHDSSAGVEQVTRFALPFSSEIHGEACTTRFFALPPQVSAQLVQVGPTGRAVWLEHNWETQTRRVMRYHPQSGNSVGLLLPSDPVLPFTPNLCHSLAFDEVTGRVCMGLFNGDVYILDFV